MRVAMIGFSVLILSGIYVAALVQNVDYAVAAQHLSWLLGGGIIAASLGLMARALL